MKFYFCETCGKRLTEHDIDDGVARNKKLKGVFCRECAVGVTTMESLPVSDNEALELLEHKEKQRPRRTTGQAPVRMRGQGHPAATRSAGSRRLPAREPSKASLWLASGAGLLMIVGLVAWAFGMRSTGDSEDARRRTGKAAKRRGAQTSRVKLKGVPGDKTPSTETGPVAGGNESVHGRVPEEASIAPLREGDRPAPAAPEVAPKSVATPATEEERKKGLRDDADSRPATGSKQESTAPAEPVKLKPPAIPSNCFDGLLNLVGQRKWAAARALLSGEEGLTEETRGVLKGALDFLAEEDERYLQALKAQLSRTIHVPTARGRIRGRLTDVGASGLRLRRLFTINGEERQGGPMEIPFSEVKASYRTRLAPPRAPKAESEWVGRILESWSAGRCHEALGTLGKIASRPIHDTLKRELTARDLKRREAAAREAWDEMMAAWEGRPKAEQAKKLRERLKTFVSTHASAPYFERLAGKARVADFDKKLDFVAAGLDARLANAFHGRVASYDPGTSRIHLVYDFSSKDQLKDLNAKDGMSTSRWGGKVRWLKEGGIWIETVRHGGFPLYLTWFRAADLEVKLSYRWRQWDPKDRTGDRRLGVQFMEYDEKKKAMGAHLITLMTCSKGTWWGRFDGGYLKYIRAPHHHVKRTFPEEGVLTIRHHEGKWDALLNDAPLISTERKVAGRIVVSFGGSSCKGHIMRNLEIEGYLHPDVIRDALTPGGGE
jgi:hypothetical protein